MATYAVALQAMDKEWAELEQKDRVLAAKDAELLRGEARLKEAEATAKLREQRLQYEMSKTMRPMTKPFLPTSTPSLEFVADNDLAEPAAQAASMMGSKCTKNAAARTEKQVSHQRYDAARGKEQRAVDAQRKARHCSRLQSRIRRFDFGVLEDEVPASSAMSEKAKQTAAEGKLELPEPVKDNVCRSAGEEMPRSRILAKRAAETREREVAKRATRRRLDLQGKRCSIGSRSDESEEAPALKQPVAAAPSEEDKKPSSFGAKVKSWFGSLLRSRTSTESTACTSSLSEATMMPAAKAAEAGDVPASGHDINREMHRRTSDSHVRKEVKQAHFNRNAVSRSLRRHVVASLIPGARPHAAKARSRQGDGIVKVVLDIDAVVMGDLIQELLSVPALALHRTAAEQQVDLDLIDGFEGSADVQKPCHGARNSSTLTPKQLSSRRWLASRGKELRARDNDRKAREIRRGEARGRKFADAAVLEVA